MPDTVTDAQTEALIELIFFAYRDFISDPDAILAEFDFGRAHHRVLHFIDRKPGLTVAELLDFLGITKQSLGRVLKQLVDGGYVRQHHGSGDRRRRELYMTDKGAALIARLRQPQSRRIRAALDQSGQRAEDIAAFLRAMTGSQTRGQMTALDRHTA
ncbi:MULTISPECIES: MarR family transcriptional regulator [unclassified Roseitalea]|uniref:MarR family winged helix-turn-helix transcriptional regulator n=1 Tax=unclassified Roseitalea TaxID=2639107 RepID=UPI00273DE95D|nr:MULTISPECIES: MarR family transcriptional regulator [unclassified Roseitalea]